MNLPSGDHLALSGATELWVNWKGPSRGSALYRLRVAPVAESNAASQICCEPLRLLRNRMLLSSGENCTPESPGWVTAILNGSPPSIFCSHSSGVLVFLARSTVVTEYASHLPSGETAVSPSRFICIMSSKVMGRLFWAGAMGRKTEARIQQRKNLNAVMRGLLARWKGAALREEQVYTEATPPGDAPRALIHPTRAPEKGARMGHPLLFLTARS